MLHWGFLSGPAASALQLVEVFAAAEHGASPNLWERRAVAVALAPAAAAALCDDVIDPMKNHSNY